VNNRNRLTTSTILLGLAIIGFVVQDSATLAEPFDPNVGSNIDTFLSGPVGINQQASPIAGNGSVFFSSGVANNVDPRLIMAIAGAESSFGTNWVNCPASGFNAWSWFYNDGTGSGRCALAPFASFADGIQRVSTGVGGAYIRTRHETTIAAIGATYCGSGAGCASWANNVTKYYTQLNGDVSDLRFDRTLIDFEQLTGPAVFTGVQSPLTIGVATISGGQILAGTTYLPADSSVLYGTAYFCPGCSPSITITFSAPVSNFSLFLYNGQTFTVTYTVQDQQGNIQTVSLVANNQSGYSTVTLPSTGITQVVITSDTGQWDFEIDNIRFSGGN
jgi:hypothetical protein